MGRDGKEGKDEGEGWGKKWRRRGKRKEVGEGGEGGRGRRRLEEPSKIVPVGVWLWWGVHTRLSLPLSVPSPVRCFPVAAR